MRSATREAGACPRGRGDGYEARFLGLGSSEAGGSGAHDGGPNTSAAGVPLAPRLGNVGGLALGGRATPCM